MKVIQIIDSVGKLSGSYNNLTAAKKACTVIAKANTSDKRFPVILDSNGSRTIIYK